MGEKENVSTATKNNSAALNFRSVQSDLLTFGPPSRSSKIACLVQFSNIPPAQNEDKNSYFQERENSI